jgi:hypothetical protein
MRTIYRYVVPVDDQAHFIELTGEIRAVGCRSPWNVEFWAEHNTEARPVERTFQVFGTGHPLPHQARHVGTAVAPGDALVWHLYDWHLYELPVGFGPTVVDDVPPNAGSAS